MAAFIVIFLFGVDDTMIEPDCYEINKRWKITPIDPSIDNYANLVSLCSFRLGRVPSDIDYRTVCSFLLGHKELANYAATRLAKIVSASGPFWLFKVTFIGERGAYVLLVNEAGTIGRGLLDISVINQHTKLLKDIMFTYLYERMKESKPVEYEVIFGSARSGVRKALDGRLYTYYGDVDSTHNYEETRVILPRLGVDENE